MIIEGSYIEKYKIGIEIEEYDGQIGIVACQEGQDGKVYVRWVYAQRNKATVEKPIPYSFGCKDFVLCPTSEGLAKGFETELGGLRIKIVTI